MVVQAIPRDEGAGDEGAGRERAGKAASPSGARAGAAGTVS